MTQAVAERVERMAPAVEAVEAVEAASNVTDAFLSMIERAARDPAVDIDKMERLFQMRQQVNADIAERLFAEAMAKMQPELPIVQQNGTITIYDKNDTNRSKPPIQSTKFAKWEDINEAIVPILCKHGFSLTFGAAKDGDRVVVTGTVRHRGGHKEQTTLSLALDSSGSKNNVQAVGSSISYGKRYCAGLLLNITSRAKGDADDDGAATTSGPARLTEEQVMDMRDLLESTGANVGQFLRAAKVEQLEEIEASKFDSLCAAIRRRAAERDAK